MKKSILALAALTVAGGLGLAGSAQAVYSFAPGSTAVSATGLELNPGSTGHELIIPYYSVENNNVTLMSIVNTDATNGKAVKVRFRGAANSDDVLDFTVLMSPGDVWTATIFKGSDGLAHLSSNDHSCTIPSNANFNDVPFITNRLPSYISGPQQAQNTTEGYVEILNMADIPKNTAGASPLANTLYNDIKHVNGTPPCAGAWSASASVSGVGTPTAGQDAITDLTDTNDYTGADLLNFYGLDAPSGQLTGGWLIVNQQNSATFSGNDTAVRAYSDPMTGTTIGATGTTNVMFSPQIATPANIAANSVTADPLLTGGWEGAAEVPSPLNGMLWYDVPDLSSPMGFTGATTTNMQADLLANALSKLAVNDEFVNNPNGTNGSAESTDWVLSQPTRRYFAVVDYGTSASAAQIMYNDWTNATINPAVTPVPTNFYSSGAGSPDSAEAGTNAPYAGTGSGAGNLQLITNLTANPGYPEACLVNVAPTMTDREEGSVSVGASFSPGTTKQVDLCGEVATITFGQSPLNAAITNATADTSILAGWMQFALPLGSGTQYGAPTPNNGAGATYGLPMIGYSATSDTGGGVGLGQTLPLRW